MLEIKLEDDAFVLLHAAQDGTITRFPLDDDSVEALAMSAESLRAMLAAKQFREAATGAQPIAAIPVVNFSVERDAMQQFVLMTLESPTRSRQVFALRPNIGRQLAAGVENLAAAILGKPDEVKH